MGQMKVYLTPPQPSRGLQRIADALTRYAPGNVEIVQKQADADLVIIYAIGRQERVTRECDWILDGGRKYGIIQVCLRSTMTPETRDWEMIWKCADVVWSYYDLHQAIAEDQNLPLQFVERAYGNFYHAPLGVDSEVFTADPAVRKLFKIATSGASRLQESVRECWLAAQVVNGHVYHVGSRRGDKGIVYSDGCSDISLSASYQQCEFVSGLRRKEGFELPAAEGLLCGARPILFDTPDYRWNYKHWGEYIQETDRQGVVDQLVELFKKGARPVTQEERAEAAEWFNWETICKGFWERCL